jgi:L-alanine-DL-glutamate epimerase-like enolase superfamily enzyme
MIYIRAISEQLAEKINVPDKPGLGIDVDEDAIANSPLYPDNYMSTR